MIKITPYYHRSKQECQEILTLYLKMVADVVPFLPKDVLDEVPESLKKTPRRRMEPYQKLLGDHKIPVEIKKSEQDALLARKLIESYSKKLHDFLYQGMPDDCCNVNRENLRQLLLIQLPSGELPAVMDFRPPDAGSEDEKKRKDLLLKYVFCYDKFCDRDEIYHFLELLGVSVCPYCNRQYITTVSTGSRRTRPQLDHFKNKSTYPFLALSINNLVPSCGICNLLKHDNDEAMLYPYEEEMGDRYRFRTVDKNGKFTSLRTGATRASHEFDVGLVCTGNKYEPTTVHARNSIENLALEKLYQSHKSYITSLYFQRYIHTDVFYEDMIRQFPSLFFPNYDPDSGTLTDDQINEIKEGLKRAMFLMDYRQDAWGDRPLAKLTHDIAMEIDKRSE